MKVDFFLFPNSPAKLSEICSVINDTTKCLRKHKLIKLAISNDFTNFALRSRVSVHN